MRTRLDEIVESERENGSYHYSAEGERCRQMRIAERAFRHGVEQAIACFLPESGYGHLIQPAVAGSQQPGPASEKTCHCGCGEAIGRDGFRHDRRKAERRMFGEWRRGGWILAVVRGQNWTVNDRRSGRDRRTPKG